mgnify:CR=1 FL=1
MDPNTAASNPPHTDGNSVPIIQTPPIPTPPLPMVSTPTKSDLTIEEQVAKELGSVMNAPAEDKLDDKAKKLTEARHALEEKISALENDVKTKLATLKELKVIIEEEIQKIKELKETEGKIDVELHKIDELEKKRDEIEREIKIIEETTTAL